MLFGGRLTEIIMQNLSSKLLAVTEIANEIFGTDLENAYVISLWEHRLTFSSTYKMSIAGRAMKMDGATSEINTSGFTTITFNHFDLTIEIVLS